MIYVVIVSAIAIFAGGFLSGFAFAQARAYGRLKADVEAVRRLLALGEDELKRRVHSRGEWRG
jgi:hypothetical protein